MRPSASQAAGLAMASMKTQLLDAAREGLAARLLSLLERGAAVDAKDSLGRTALMLACEGGHAETAGLLLDRGADIEAKNVYGDTALMLAGGENVMETTRLLLDRGADALAADGQGRTAMEIARDKGNCDLAIMLSEYKLRSGMDAVIAALGALRGPDGRPLVADLSGRSLREVAAVLRGHPSAQDFLGAFQEPAETSDAQEEYDAPASKRHRHT